VPSTSLRSLVAAALVVGPLAAGCRQSPEPGAAQAALPDAVVLQTFDFGGDFQLQSHTGQPFSLSELRGRVVLLFFGYTYCPDVCPTTLSTMAQVQRLLGPDADRVTSLFVSVDPERDDAERLREYIGHFEARTIAVTGSKAQLDAVVKQYAAYYEKVASDSATSYTVDHTSRLYLIDTRGRLRHLFRYGDEAAVIAEGVRLALRE
jgi:protein SCO1/2